MEPGVCMVISSFWPDVGGMQTHTLALSRYLVSRGLDVVVITVRHSNLRAYEVVEGVPVYRISRRPGAGLVESALEFIGGAWRLMFKLRHRFQIVHAHQLLSTTTVGLMARCVPGKKLLVNPHSGREGGTLRILLQDRRLSGKLRLRLIARGADAVVAISHEIRQDLIGLGVPGSKIVEIPNGVDTNVFVPLPPKDKARKRGELGIRGDPVGIYVGRLSRVKAVDVLLRAWSRAFPGHRRAQLVILGDGPERGRLESLADELGIAGSVVMPGFVDNVSDYLMASDFFVLPSRSEGHPVALLEAMACGLAVVGSDTGGIADVVDEGRDGYLVPVADVDALSSVICDLVGDSALRRKLGAAAREKAVSRYSIERTGRRYCELYRRLVAEQI